MLSATVSSSIHYSRLYPPPQIPSLSPITRGAQFRTLGYGIVDWVAHCHAPPFL